jgi:hypothetical protein
MILDTQESRDVFNVIELKALTWWSPEQNMPQKTLGPIPPPRTVEERARGIYVKKSENLQHVLRDGERWYEI